MNGRDEMWDTSHKSIEELRQFLVNVKQGDMLP